MHLTNTAIKNARPQAKAKRYFDGGGLYLEISPTGGSGGGLNIVLTVRRKDFPSACIRK
jgi:hypothetical protein